MNNSTWQASTMRLTTIVLGLACASLACGGLAGCVSTERQAAADRDACTAQGLAPASNAFDDCMSLARARRREADARQFDRMQQVQDRSMSDFMHSQAVGP